VRGGVQLQRRVRKFGIREPETKGIQRLAREVAVRDTIGTGGLVHLRMSRRDHLRNEQQESLSNLLMYLVRVHTHHAERRQVGGVLVEGMNSRDYLRNSQQGFLMYSHLVEGDGRATGRRIVAEECGGDGVAALDTRIPGVENRVARGAHLRREMRSAV